MILYELLRTYALDNLIDRQRLQNARISRSLQDFIASACVYRAIPSKCTHMAIQRVDIHYGLESLQNDRLVNVITVSQRITEQGVPASRSVQSPRIKGTYNKLITHKDHSRSFAFKQKSLIYYELVLVSDQSYI